MAGEVKRWSATPLVSELPLNQARVVKPVPAGGTALAHSLVMSPEMCWATHGVASPLMSSKNTTLLVVPTGQVPGTPVVKVLTTEFALSPQ